MSQSQRFAVRLSPRQRMAATWTGRRVEADATVGLPSTLTQLLSLHYTAEVLKRERVYPLAI